MADDLDAYQAFLNSKRLAVPSVGFDVDTDELHPQLFDYQRAIVQWGLRKGRACFFTGTGTGKTLMELSWASKIHEHTNGDVLILAPLGVAQQTAREEGPKFGVNVHLCRTQDDVKRGINVTNYDRLHLFHPDAFAAVVLDESSAIKDATSATRNTILEKFARTPYKLAASATPAPNSYTEFGNHSEFLGVMERSEMLPMFFTHDGGDTSTWILRGWAQEEFWKWVCQWAVILRKPSDLGFSDEGFELPPLNMYQHTVESPEVPEGMLMPVEALTLTEQRKARKASIEQRVAKCVEIVNKTDRSEPWLIWIDLNDEQRALEKAFGNRCISVYGSLSADEKEARIVSWLRGERPIFLCKPSIAGHGLNFQHCHNMGFVGVSHSFEYFFQAVRRCWRFGQKHPVNCHVITSSAEGAVVANLQRKEADAERMADGMIRQTHEITTGQLRAVQRDTTIYDPHVEMILPDWLVSEVA